MLRAVVNDWSKRAAENSEPSTPAGRSPLEEMKGSAAGRSTVADCSQLQPWVFLCVPEIDLLRSQGCRRPKDNDKAGDAAKSSVSWSQ